MKIERVGWVAWSSALSALVVVTAVTASCRQVIPPFGGEKERALATATAARDLAKVRSALETGADPNKMVSYEGVFQSPWYQALHALRPKLPDTAEIVKVMLKAGADPHTAWRQGTPGGGSAYLWESPLLLAIEHPDVGVLRALVPPNPRPLRWGEQALLAAVESNELEVVRVLVEAGVDVNCRPSANTPLLSAIEARSVPIMTYLEEHGAREKP